MFFRIFFDFNISTLLYIQGNKPLTLNERPAGMIAGILVWQFLEVHLVEFVGEVLGLVSGLSTHYIRRRYWIELACNLAVAYHPYQTMRSCADVSVAEPTLEDIEENIPIFNQILGLDITLSDIYDAKQSSTDTSIIYYKHYKEILKILDGKLFIPEIADKLYKELYEEYREIPMAGFVHQYYYEVARLILQYMCTNIDYNTFIKRLLAIKIVKAQKPMDGMILKEMIKTGEKWVSRYLELVKAEREKIA